MELRLCPLGQPHLFLFLSPFLLLFSTLGTVPGRKQAHQVEEKWEDGDTKTGAL
jgi:hypothetical protein